jgi:xeroderma pigmentosum group C-complementing protein
VPARLVHNVSVLNLSFSKSTSIASPPAPTGQKTARKRKRKVKSSDVSDVSDEEEDVVKVEDVQHTFIWAEILDPETKEWLYVNPIRRYELGHSKIVYDCLKGKISYIFAFEPKSRRIKDVTVKYVSTLQLKKCRDNLWIDETIRNHFQSHPPFDSEADQLENEKFADLEDACEPPTTISGFLNHPKYVLERHLKKFETIHPKVAVPGKSIRGESIYLRANVCTLHTADKWLSLEGRVVKREERGHPIKYVKSRAYSSSKNSEKGKIVMLGEEEGEEDAENMHNSGKVAVFGIWQTEVYVPAPIVNGIIPKNKYNNFDLFKPSMLPPGAAHITEESLVDDAEREYNEIQIRLPSLKKIARKLKCDFAEAVIGFEYHGGRSVPTINGIIVAQENEEAVRKEFMSQLFEQMETFRESKFTDAVRRWERLTKKALIYERLKKKFLK